MSKFVLGLLPYVVIATIAGALLLGGTESSEESSSAGEMRAQSVTPCQKDVNASELIHFVNAKRAASGLPTFAYDPALEAYAAARAAENAGRGNDNAPTVFGNGTNMGYYAWRNASGQTAFVKPAFESTQDLPWSVYGMKMCSFVDSWVTQANDAFMNPAMRYMGAAMAGDHVDIMLASPSRAAPVYQASPQQAQGYTGGYGYGYGGDVDCADVSYSEAQNLSRNGDPYGLDGDGDGEACEWNY